jgi:hypothetical protein
MGASYWLVADALRPVVRAGLQAGSVPASCCAVIVLYCPAQVKKCLSIKGAEDAINKPHAFEVSTTDCSMFFIADSDKVCVCVVGGGSNPGGGYWG